MGGKSVGPSQSSSSGKTREPSREMFPNVQQITDYPEYEQLLDLICDRCGTKGKYRVGRILVVPWSEHDKPGGKTPLEEHVAFSGLFRCRRCRSGYPWRFPPLTVTRIYALLAMTKFDPDESRIHFAKLAAFDGTPMRTGAENEDYIKRLLEEHPDDAFLWCRLGNIYNNHDDIALARPAYERAVELDPGEIESNYTLGCYCMDEGDVRGAAEHFQQVAKHARTASRRNPELLENIVRDSLERLLELHQQDETIPFPPKFDTPPPKENTRPDESVVVYMTRFDLGTEEGWDTLTTLCLTGKMPDHVMRRARQATEPAMRNQRRLPAGPPEREVATTAPQGRRVGRNDPCPCGSGKKYKRCCG